MDDKSNGLTDDKIMMKWYRYAVEQPDAVESLLRVLRERTGQTAEEQRAEFGASDEHWLRLRGFRLPREDTFSSDARRIAEVCQLANPFVFVQQLKLARKLTDASPASGTGQFYRAAFDAQDGLDRAPEGEEELDA